MVNIEQVRLLESRVTKAIDYVNRVTDENALLKKKLESCQKRVDELEVLIQRFKEDQARIEEGIVSALNHLNRFEDDVEKTLAGGGSGTPVAAAPPAPARTADTAAAGSAGAAETAPVAPVPPAEVPANEAAPPLDPVKETGETYDDLSAAYTVDEAGDAALPPESAAYAEGASAAGPPAANAKELDIF